MKCYRRKQTDTMRGDLLDWLQRVARAITVIDTSGVDGSREPYRF
jgi:hypothetical protein